MCDFANEKTPDYFIHPVYAQSFCTSGWRMIIRSWTATGARRAHCFTGHASPRILAVRVYLDLHDSAEAPVKYARSFLYTETDDNDLTYFIVAQTQVIRRAVQDLHGLLTEDYRGA